MKMAPASIPTIGGEIGREYHTLAPQLSYWTLDP